MDLILFILLILVTLVQIIFFHGGILQGCIVIAFSSYYIVLKYIKKHTFQKWERVAYLLAAIGLMLTIAFTFHARVPEGNKAYGDELVEIIELIEKQKYNEAEDRLESLTDEYGPSDKSHMISALIALEEGNYENAKDEMSRVDEQESQIAYLIREKILLSDPTTTNEKFEDFYEEAVERYPEWESMLIMCGYMKLGAQNYSEAQYYLGNAYVLNCKNPMTCYYLGALQYYEKKYELALDYFDEAIENGADEETKENINWFLDEMGYSK